MNATLYATADAAREVLRDRGYRNLMGGCWFARIDGQWHQAIVEAHYVGISNEIEGYGIDDSIDRGDWQPHWDSHAARNGLAEESI